VTVIISVAVPPFVFQVADRRITSRSNGRPHVEDDASNKAILYDGRFCLAYTGSAQIALKRADIWVAERLCEASTVKTGFQHVRDGLSDLWASRPSYRDRAFTLVGVGWVFSPEPTPAHCIISNVMRPGPVWLPEPARDFEFQMDVADPLRGVSVWTAPAWMSDQETGALRGRVLEALDEKKSLEAIIALVVASLRDVADRHEEVGHDLMLSVIPQRAATPSGDWPAVTGGPISDDVPTFLHLPVRRDPIRYGPTSASPGGGAMTDFSGGR
jgi:hypothetical protein